MLQNNSSSQDTNKFIFVTFCVNHSGLEKVSFHSNPQEGQCQRTFRLYTIVLISHATKVMLKFFKLGFSSNWTENLQMYKLDFKKEEEPKIKLPTIVGT